jgi:alpha-glucosidase
MLLLTLRGTPTMYYGDEIGMSNVEIPPEKYQDPQALNEPGVNVSRDRERTPMQWDNSPYAGFATVESWLPIAADYATRNVKGQETEPRSMVNMVKQLLRIRQHSPAINHGAYTAIPVATPDVMAYLRTEGAEWMLVVLNFADETKTVNLVKVSPKGQIILSTQMDRTAEVSLNTLQLRPHEGLVIQLSR